MHKLTVILGPNRGTSYPVQEGELSIGRQSGNTVVLPSSKISKRHCTITVKGSQITLQDQGSSNGTFVNGILTKIKVLKPGDRISVGEYVIELSEYAKKPVGPAPAVAGFRNIPKLNPNSSLAGAGLVMPTGMTNVAQPNVNQPPKDLKGKLIWIFEHKVMPIFYGMNLKYEWNMICVGLFSALVLGNLILSVYPILESNRATIVKELGIRARFMARQIAEQNAPYLAARNETKTDIGIIETAEGVRVAALIDLDSRIIAPGTKMNQYLASGSEAVIAVKARDRFRAGGETGFWVEGDSETIVAVEPVKIASAAAGKNIVVAMAVVSMDASLATPDLGEVGTIYSETLITTGLLAGLILLILYRLTLKPFQVLNEDLDKALKGDISQVTHEFKLQELNPLWDIINSAVQRVGKSSSGGMGGLGDELSLSHSIEEFLGPLRTIGNIIKIGMVIFDSDKKIVFINSMFEEMSGVRSDSSIGQEMSAVARDQSLGAFTSDILGRAPVGGDGISEDYDFSGVGYKVHAAAFGQSGASAKCFVMIAARVEG